MLAGASFLSAAALLPARASAQATGRLALRDCPRAGVRDPRRARSSGAKWS